MGRLDNKVAIVTGGGGGIGTATCLTLAREGASVAVADIDEAKAERCAAAVRAAGGVAQAVVVDIADEASVRQAVAAVVERFGHIHILDNNATIAAHQHAVPDRTVTDMAVETWDRTMEVNLRGTMLMCKHTIPVIIQSGGGSVINISSGAAIVGDVRPVAYGVSKAGINAMTRYIAAAYGKQGVRCNTIMPGSTETETFLELTPPARLDMHLRHSLLSRLGRPEDIANAVLFLASDESAMITGQDFGVDGGMLIHTPFMVESAQVAPVTDQRPDTRPAG
jgi:NAD(P)-dependent dehydrogenase (short-subunit alcohol dehydrogenase family)